MTSILKHRTLKSEIGQRSLRAFRQAERDLDLVYEKLHTTLSEPRSAFALLNPNLPETLERSLCKLAQILLGETAWSITLGGREIGSGGLSPGGSTSVQESLDFTPGSFIQFMVGGARLQSQAGEFQFLARMLTESTIEYQKELLARLLPGGERVADDDVYRFLWPKGEVDGIFHLLNLSYSVDSREMTMTRLLSGPETARRLIGRLTSAEILRRDILASIDLILNWNFPFKDTNTYKAFLASQQGRSTFYFPNWWAVGSLSYSNPNAVLANTLRKGMQSSAVFGESDYLLAPLHRSNNRTLTLVVRGGPQLELEGEAQGLSVERSLIQRLVLPGRLGYELYDNWLPEIEHEIARALAIMSESSQLFRKEREDRINWHIVNLLKAALEDGSGWSVNPETSHGSGRVKEGRPDLLLRYSLRPQLTIVGECKKSRNIREGLYQLSRYVGSTTDAALLIAYQTERKPNAWDSLRSRLIKAASALNLGLESILGVPGSNGAVWEGVTWLHVHSEPVKSIPLRIFLVDLAR